MKVEWGWDDGYAGGRPKFVLDIPDEDLEGLSPLEQDRVIDEYVRDEFQNQVTYWWDRK